MSPIKQKDKTFAQLTHEFAQCRADILKDAVSLVKSCKPNETMDMEVIYDRIEQMGRKIDAFRSKKGYLRNTFTPNVIRIEKEIPEITEPND